MRKYIYYTDNQTLQKLLTQFELNQGELYHYTSLESAKSIKTNRELWLTRSDQTIDISEIKYGINVLINATRDIFNQIESEKFNELINIITPRLVQSYLFCLTETKNSSRHIEIHGNTQLTFEFDFPELLLNSGRIETNINSDYQSVELIRDSYILIEGKVIYDIRRQTTIAKSICNFYKQAIASEMHIVDINLFSDVIFQFIILLKEQSYSWENEYRVCIVKTGKTGAVSEFNTPNKKIANKVHFATIEFDKTYYTKIFPH